jgi:hypothetical protein
MDVTPISPSLACKKVGLIIFQHSKQVRDKLCGAQHLARTKAFTPSAVGNSKPLIHSSHVVEKEKTLAPKGTNQQEPTIKEVAPEDRRVDLLIYKVSGLLESSGTDCIFDTSEPLTPMPSHIVNAPQQPRS